MKQRKRESFGQGRILQVVLELKEAEVLALKSVVTEHFREQRRSLWPGPCCQRAWQLQEARREVKVVVC